MNILFGAGLCWRLQRSLPFLGRSQYRLGSGAYPTPSERRILHRFSLWQGQRCECSNQIQGQRSRKNVSKIPQTYQSWSLARLAHHSKGYFTTYNLTGASLYWSRSPSLGACNYPILLLRRFHRPIYFYVEFISNSDTHRNLSDQLQSQARTNVDMSTWCRHVHVRPHCVILTEACSCRLELAYFAGKISKNRLVCNNAVALTYYGSCSLLVMGSWQEAMFFPGLTCRRILLGHIPVL